MPDELALPTMPPLVTKLLARLKGKAEVGLLAVGLAALTLILGLAGCASKLFDGSIHSVASIALHSFASFTPSLKNLEGGNVLTDAAAVCGLLTLYSSAMALVVAFLGESARKAKARHLDRDHAIVIGDTPFALQAHIGWSGQPRAAIQIVAPDTPKSEVGAGRRVRHALDVAIAASFSLHRAGRVLIDLDDDVRTITLAYGLIEAISDRLERTQNTRAIEAEWTLVVRDGMLADHLASRLALLRRTSTIPLPAVQFVDPERIVARYILARHPPFLAPERRGLSRIHVVILDFGSLGRHLLERIFLTSPVAGQPPAKVTVLCEQPETQRRLFFRGRTSLADEIDVAFLERDSLSALFEPHDSHAPALLRSDRSDPVTGIFLSTADPKGNLEIAVLLHRLAARTGHLDCPVFIREDQSESMRALLLGSIESGSRLSFVPFGLPADIACATLKHSRERDALARALHQVYATSIAPREVATWDALPETMRRANCNAADHCLAKLHSLGLDVTSIAPNALPRLLEDDAAALDPADLEGVVRLEHERWRLERLFDGWAHAPTRDDERQLHPLILPWADLVRDFPEQIAKNRAQVHALLGVLRDCGAAAPVKRRQKPVTLPVPDQTETVRAVDRCGDGGYRERMVLPSRNASL